MKKIEKQRSLIGHVFDGLTATCNIDTELSTNNVTTVRDIFLQRRDLGIEPSTSGILFHGAVHFWQVFASGYIANLIASEWERLIQYENNGSIPASPAVAQTYFEDDAEVGFSAGQLQESWARFWETWTNVDDVERQSNAMRAGPDSPVFAQPYQWLLETLEGNVSLAAWVFPALCFHAFGTRVPVQVFCKGAQRAAQSQALRKLAAQSEYTQIQDGWLKHWNTLVNESVIPVLVERGEMQSLRGIELIQSGAMRSHPIYAEYLEFFVAMQQAWRQAAAISDETQVVARDLAALRTYSSETWLAFAVPGHPLCKSALSHFLPPPLIRARDTLLAARRPANLRLRESRAGVSRVSDSYRQHALAIETRVQRFRAAKRAQQLGLPLDAFAM